MLLVVVVGCVLVQFVGSCVFQPVLLSVIINCVLVPLFSTCAVDCCGWLCTGFVCGFLLVQ